MRKRIVSILLIVMLFNLVIMPINTVYAEQSDIIWLEEDYDWVNAFSEGLSIIRLDGKYGFIDKMGIEVVSPKYHYLSFFSEGLAIAELNGKWGVINKIEKEVIPFKYDYIDFGYMKNPFGEGLIAVQLDGRWGYLDNTNTEVIPLEYDNVSIFSVGVAILKVNDKWGIMQNSLLNKSEIKLKAIPTSSNILTNGKKVYFDAYLINNNNYFKLRDLATVVNGTEKQFEVTWDEARRAISLISNKSYTPVGGEMIKGDGQLKEAIPNTSAIYKDGSEIKLVAYTINGNNYFKLRDVAEAFNIGVTWDDATKTIRIDTKSDYIAD